jgi:DNA-binding beta-propeller fold protein YncE
MKRVLLAMLCVGVLAGSAAPALGAAPDPDFTLSGYEGPCGLAVDVAGNLYVSNYYGNAVLAGGAQLSNIDPVDGPCGLAVDNSGRLYVNDYHRWVQRFTIAGFPTLDSRTVFIPGPRIDSSTPTGVAVDPVVGNVYVNARDHIAAYDSSGAPILTIGAGVLRDGYGIAFSQFSGSLYVSDYADNTVKVFSSLSGNLLSTIDGIGVPNRRFISLRDSALAVDRVNGDVYVTDAVGSPLSERPEAIVYVFDSTGAYKGQLKYRISTASPPGLAVDNSAGVTQGRVYVTSGITEQAVVYAYPRGSATSSSLPTQFSLDVSTSGSGSGSVTSEWVGLDCDSTCEAQVRAGTSISLTATPEPGSVFTGWSGAGCSGTGDCSIEMSEARSVSAGFAPVEGPAAPTPAQAANTAPTAAPYTGQRKRAGKRRCVKRRNHAGRSCRGKHRKNGVNGRATKGRDR